MTGVIFIELLSNFKYANTRITGFLVLDREKSDCLMINVETRNDSSHSALI